MPPERDERLTELLEGRLHPLAVVILGVGSIRFLLAGGAVVLLSVGDPAMIIPILVLGALAAAGIGLLSWLRFRYRIEGGALIVERGVLVQQRRVVPLDRVRGVDISAPPLHRLLGLVKVSVDAAGAGGDASELSLAAIGRAEADRLRDRVLRRRAEASAGGDAIETTETLARVSTATLALAGATSWRWLVAPLVALGALANVAGPEEALFDFARGQAEDLAPTSGPGIALVVVAGLALTAAIAATGSVLVDGGFRLSDTGGRLMAERGLLRRRVVSMDRARIGAVERGDSPLWRLVGLSSLRALVAGVGGGSGEAAGRTLLLPAGRDDEVGALLDHLGEPAAPALVRHPPAARRRRLVRAVELPVAAAVVSLAARRPEIAAGFAALAVLMVPIALDRYRSLGSAYDGRRLALREGCFGRRLTVIVPGAVVQYRLVSSPLQRRAGLCTLVARLGRGAGSRRALDVAESRAVELLARIEPDLVEPFLETGTRVGDPEDHAELPDSPAASH
jgi:putative membrane protein